MEQNETGRKVPGEAAGDGRARHGYRNEVSWDGGKGAQPYANQEAPTGPAGAHETEAGNRGAASGRNLAQMEQLRRTPERPADQAARPDAVPEAGER